MNLSLYVPGATPLHRAPAGPKLALLLVAGIGLFLTSSPALLGSAAIVAAMLLASTRPSAAHLRQQLSGIAVIMAFFVVATGLFQGWLTALVVLFRITALVLLALAVTLSTRSSDVLETLERALAPLERLNLADAGRVSLAVSLVLRFVPELFKRVQEIREAQAARGLDANPLALVVPLVVRTLRSADEIAEAIDARGYPPPPRGFRASPQELDP